MRAGWYNEIEAFKEKWVERGCFILTCQKCNHKFFMETVDTHLMVIHPCKCAHSTRHATVKSFNSKKEFILECATCKKEFEMSWVTKINSNVVTVIIGDCDCESK